MKPFWGRWVPHHSFVLAWRPGQEACLSTIVSPQEDRLAALRQATGRFSASSASLQAQLTGLVDQTGQLGGPLSWLRSKVNEQVAAQREAAGLVSKAGLKVCTLGKAGGREGEAECLPVERVEESIRPTLERALEQSRALTALDPTGWALPGEEAPVLATALHMVQAMFGQIVHSLMAMPAGREKQIHWAEGTKAFLDQTESRLGLLMRRSRDLARETAWRADWLAWVREAVRVVQKHEKPGSNLVERLDCLTQEVAETAVLGADLSKVWWQPALDETDASVWVAADGWNMAWVACEVARLEGVNPRALVGSETLHACFLHDVGMALIDKELWQQAGRLEGADRRQMEAHTRRAEELVGKLMPGRHAVRRAVQWHHERIDGTGYPDSFKGPELSPLSKWISVLDVYCGLQLERAHRKAVSSVDAWRTVQAWSRQGLLEQSEVARLDLVGPLPAGTLLRLSDGALGVGGGCVTQGDVSSAWVIPITNGSGQVLAIPQGPLVIDPRLVVGVGRGVGDIVACHGAERMALLKEVCPWLG